MPQIGPAEILVVLLVALLVFGPHRLPEVGRQVGKGMRELRKFQNTVRGELDEVLHFHEDSGEASPTPPPLPAGDTAAPATPVAPGPASASGARAPSRFRAPGTPPRA
jgi:Tat protein translocase TatB subunit